MSIRTSSKRATRSFDNVDSLTTAETTAVKRARYNSQIPLTQTFAATKHASRLPVKSVKSVLLEAPTPLAIAAQTRVVLSAKKPILTAKRTVHLRLASSNTKHSVVVAANSTSILTSPVASPLKSAAASAPTVVSNTARRKLIPSVPPVNVSQINNTRTVHNAVRATRKQNEAARDKVPFVTDVDADVNADEPTSKKAAPQSLLTQIAPAIPAAATAEEAPSTAAPVTTLVAQPVPLLPTFVPSNAADTQTLLQSIVECLDLASAPLMLPSRNAHMDRVQSFLHYHVANRTSATLYIAGSPGTGKTLCVHSVLSDMFGAQLHYRSSQSAVTNSGGYTYNKRSSQTKTNEKPLPTTVILTLNAMALADASQLFHRLCLCWLKAESAVSTQDEAEIMSLSPAEATARFRHHVEECRHTKSAVVIVIDEMDVLTSRTTNKSPLLNKLFDMSSLSPLVLIGISNRIDLDSRVLPQLRDGKHVSGSEANKLVFQCYERDDLKTIIEERLWRGWIQWRRAQLEQSLTTSDRPKSGRGRKKVEVSASADDTNEVLIKERRTMNLPIVESRALDFACMKVAGRSGDIRQCLHIVRAAMMNKLSSLQNTSASEAVTSATATSDATAVTAFKPASYIISAIDMIRCVSSMSVAVMNTIPSLTDHQKLLLMTLAFHAKHNRVQLTYDEFHTLYRETALQARLPIIQRSECDDIVWNLISLGMIALRGNMNVQHQTNHGNSHGGANGLHGRTLEVCINADVLTHVLSDSKWQRLIQQTDKYIAETRRK